MRKSARRVLVQIECMSAITRAKLVLERDRTANASVFDESILIIITPIMLLIFDKEDHLLFIDSRSSKELKQHPYQYTIDAMTKKEGICPDGKASPSHSSIARSNSNYSRPRSSSTSVATTLYHPSIFRYTCTGKLSLDSRNGGKSKASAGICHGIQSNLEHLDHWRLCTREDAIKQFEYKSSFGITGEEDYYNSTGSQHSGDIEASSAHAEQAVYLSNVLLYPPTPSEGQDLNNKDRNKNEFKEAMVTRKNTDGSTTITPQQESWSCYGSTEVDLLVLRPQNARDDSIAAVASYCAPGVTVRDSAISPTNIGIGSDTGGRERTTTIRLGILEVVYATVLEGYDDEKSGNKDRGKGKEIDEEGMKGETMNGYITTPTQVVHSGKKILNHMMINGQLLYESAHDSYPTRTYEASKRITNEFGKTWVRTTGLMKKVASFVFFGDDWNDQD